MLVPYRMCLEIGLRGVYIAGLAQEEECRFCLAPGKLSAQQAFIRKQPSSAEPGHSACPGVTLGRMARGDHTALTETDRISCSPQEGELRTQTRAF